jgi:hypothetical protein
MTEVSPCQGDGAGPSVSPTRASGRVALRNRVIKVALIIAAIPLACACAYDTRHSADPFVNYDFYWIIAFVVVWCLITIRVWIPRHTGGSRWLQVIPFALALLCFLLPFFDVLTHQGFTQFSGVRLMAGPWGFPAHLLVYEAPLVVGTVVSLTSAIVFCFWSPRGPVTLIPLRAGIAALILICLSAAPWHLFELSMRFQYQEPNLSTFEYDNGFPVCLVLIAAGIAVSKRMLPVKTS